MCDLIELVTEHVTEPSGAAEGTRNPLGSLREGHSPPDDISPFADSRSQIADTVSADTPAAHTLSPLSQMGICCP